MPVLTAFLNLKNLLKGNKDKSSVSSADPPSRELGRLFYQEKNQLWSTVRVFFLNYLWVKYTNPQLKSSWAIFFGEVVMYLVHYTV